MCGIWRNDALTRRRGEAVFETLEFLNQYPQFRETLSHSVLVHEEDEFYTLMDHGAGNVVDFDPFSKRLSTKGSLASFIVEYLQEAVSEAYDSQANQVMGRIPRYKDQSNGEIVE